MWFLAVSNPFYVAYYQSDFLGKGIFLSLYALSIITWTLILYKGWLTWKTKREAENFKRKLAQRSSSLLEWSSEEAANPFTRLYATLKKQTLEILTKNRTLGGNRENSSYLSSNDIEVVEGHLYTTIASQTQFLEKNLYILSTIKGLAPFLGLLGTVWGILLSFNELQLQGGGSSQAFIGGLSLALATTVIGLFNAIPALVGYNYLKSSIGDIVFEMEKVSHQMLATVELQYRRVEIS